MNLVKASKHNRKNLVVHQNNGGGKPVCGGGNNGLIADYQNTFEDANCRACEWAATNPKPVNPQTTLRRSGEGVVAAEEVNA